MKIAAFTIALAMTLSAGVHTANAQNAQNDAMTQINQMVQYRIQQVDTNNDGMISKAEMQAKNNQMFNQTDANNDGMLTQQEMVQNTIAEMQAVQAQQQRMR